MHHLVHLHAQSQATAGTVSLVESGSGGRARQPGSSTEQLCPRREGQVASGWLASWCRTDRAFSSSGTCLHLRTPHPGCWTHHHGEGRLNSLMEIVRPPSPSCMLHVPRGYCFCSRNRFCVFSLSGSMLFFSALPACTQQGRSTTLFPPRSNSLNHSSCHIHQLLENQCTSRTRCSPRYLPTSFVRSSVVPSASTTAPPLA